MIRNYMRPVTYMIKEMLPSLLTGIIVFISILLMFQVLKLTEFVLAHGVTIEVIMRLVIYLSISFLPAILPMSVLFSVLMTYGRLSTDSEIIAFKSLGVSQKYLTIPAIVIGVVMCVVSAQTYFFIGPWGAKQSYSLLNVLGSSQVISNIREGTFAEGFFDLVVYANSVNEKKGILKDVFIYDERSQSVPVTIIAQEGQILSPKDFSLASTVLRLFKGSIHRTGEGVYTKIQFENYDISLTPELDKNEKEDSPKAMTITEIHRELAKKDITSDRYLKLDTEYHKRWALPFACIIFSLIGVGLGTVVNRRMAKSGGFVVSIGLIVTYWILYVSMETIARNGTIHPAIALWLPNVLFFITALYALKQIWDK
ncbi:MAG: LPS export ABC transporter permease LptF [Bdellovibrionota bacterium]